MTRFILAAGVAALAITAPAASKPGGGHGKGGNAHATAHHAQKARGGDHAQKSNRGGHQMRAAHNNAGKGHARQAKVEKRHEARAQKQRQAHVRQVQKQREAKAERIQHQRKADRHELARRNELLGRNNAPVVALRHERERLRDLDRLNGRLADNRVGYGLGGCPPGLAKKPVPCMPPGQAKKLVGNRINSLGDRIALRDLPDRLRYVYRDTPDYYYRYGDGYVYRVNRENQLISSLLPLFGAGYTVGQPFPSSYPYYGLPTAYQPFYPTAGGYDYRYANGYVYQVNPYTGMIQDVDPLLGYGYGYGQMMPLSYSAYNVPYQYRPLYYDTADNYYRYAPGAIYQVDPQTSLITAVAALLNPNALTVGQPLPTGYGAYNVPYAYRANYYDTPDAWYRYSNGNIYRIDPTTQLVSAIVASILT